MDSRLRPRSGYPPKGVTKGMCADREEAVGSHEVIAAKCCPGRSLAARRRRGEGTKWGSWREKNTAHLRIKKAIFRSRVEEARAYRRHIPEAQSASGPFPIKGELPQCRLSGGC